MVSKIPDDWQELIAGNALDDLSQEEILNLENLLQDNPELLSEVEAFDDAFNCLAYTVPQLEPPQKLRENILATAQASITNSEQSQPISQPPITATNPQKPFQLILGIGGAIAASIITILGLRTQLLSFQLQQANTEIETLKTELRQANEQNQNIRPVLSTLKQSGTLVYTLQGSERANSASGSLVMSADKQVILLVNNLPQLSAGQVYRLWAKVPTEVSLAYCGQFNTNNQGLIQFTPSSDICGAKPTQMLITIDAISDPTTKGGPLVMQSRI